MILFLRVISFVICIFFVLLSASRFLRIHGEDRYTFLYSALGFLFFCLTFGDYVWKFLVENF